MNTSKERVKGTDYVNSTPDIVVVASYCIMFVVHAHLFHDEIYFFRAKMVVVLASSPGCLAQRWCALDLRDQRP